jgi:TRAP-type C4-dicarboxylate transport system permease small subunit
MLAWTGAEVLVVLSGEYLVSLDWMPQQITVSAIPIGAVLFVIAEALRLPKVIRDARGAGFIDTETIEAISHGAPDTAGAGTKQ